MSHEPNVRTLLFDRLGGGERTLDRGGVLESLRRELELLFNTRSSFPSQRLEGFPLTVIDYGLPALTYFSSRNPEHQNQLAAMMRVAIETYEPRLAGVQVRAVTPPDDELFLRLEISGQLVADTVSEPVSFVAGVDPRTETVTLDARA